MTEKHESKVKPVKPGGKPLVTVTVNNKPVQVEGPKVTGVQIKAAAIAQGVQLGQDFELAEELENGEQKIIGDNDVVTINKNSVFWATAPDDNS